MALTMADQKKYLRTMLGECRASLTPDFVRAASLAIQRRLLNSACYRNVSALVLYSPIQNEVDTEMVAADAIASGKEVFFPRFDRTRASIRAARVGNLSELVAGAFGIAEPPADAEVAVPQSLARAVISVPGMGFGPQGQRLGRGGGHYDRFIAALPPEAITVGLAYSFQLLDGIPEGSFDQRVQYIITESAFLCGSAPVGEIATEEAGRGGTPG